MSNIENKCQFCARLHKNCIPHSKDCTFRLHPDIIAFGQECKKEGFEAAREKQINDNSEDTDCIDKYPTITDYLNSFNTK